MLKWGYHDAAWLTKWELLDGVLTASVSRADTLLVSQRPLTFEVPRPRTPWRFPILTLQIADATLIASVGPQE